MEKAKLFLIGMAAAFAMILAPALNAIPVEAQFTTSCTDNDGNQIGTGSCPGQSQNSPNREESTTNRGGNEPPPKQTRERH